MTTVIELTGVLPYTDSQLRQLADDERWPSPVIPRLIASFEEFGRTSEALLHWMDDCGCPEADLWHILLQLKPWPVDSHIPRLASMSAATMQNPDTVDSSVMNSLQVCFDLVHSKRPVSKQEVELAAAVAMEKWKEAWADDSGVVTRVWGERHRRQAAIEQEWQGVDSPESQAALWEAARMHEEVPGQPEAIAKALAHEKATAAHGVVLLFTLLDAAGLSGQMQSHYERLSLAQRRSTLWSRFGLIWLHQLWTDADKAMRRTDPNGPKQAMARRRKQHLGYLREIFEAARDKENK